MNHSGCAITQYLLPSVNIPQWKPFRYINHVFPLVTVMHQQSCLHSCHCHAPTVMSSLLSLSCTNSHVFPLVTVMHQQSRVNFPYINGRYPAESYSCDVHSAKHFPCEHLICACNYLLQYRNVIPTNTYFHVYRNVHWYWLVHSTPHGAVLCCAVLCCAVRVHSFSPSPTAKEGKSGPSCNR